MAGDKAVDRQTVHRICTLARLEMSEKEETQAAQDMDKLINFIEQLKKVDVGDISPTESVVSHDQPLREDRVQPDVEREKLLNLAPHTIGPYYVVPKVVE